MKLGKKLLALSTFALVIGLTSCGDPNYPRTFEVDFETGATGVEIASQTVKEGYKLQLTNDILNPTNSAEHYLFRGWYEDSEYTKAFDVETYRVMDNMTLYAKWTFPTDTPSEFSIGEDAFSKTVTWVQTGVEKESDISIEVIRADKVENLIYDDRLDQWILDPVNPYKFEYDETKKESVTGQVTIDKANYKVTFERDASYGGSKYKFFIYNKGELVKEEIDIQFKGSGTQDDPYYVYNANDLKYLTTNDIPEGTYVELKSSITLKSLYSEKRGKVFNGNFKGNGYTITLKNNSALFYKTGSKAKVYDVVFTGSIASTEPSIGVVSNYNEGYITEINSLAVSVSSTGGEVNNLKTVASGGAGGIVGTNLETGKITKCLVSGSSGNTIQAKIAVGGIAGINYGTIENMTDGVDSIVGAYNGKEASSTISNSYAGSIVGINYGKIYGIKSEGKINARRVENGAEGDGANNIGGIAGYNAASGVISSCIWEGMRCVGDTNVGGIVGYNEGTIENCMTGRRLRKPSNTEILERQFISPVMGSWNVGGIAGKISTTSKITNVLSTANVWSYKSLPWTLAERVENAVGIKHNFQNRVTESYLGRTYGQVISNYLEAPVSGRNIEIVDNLEFVDYRFSYCLGWDYSIENGVVKGAVNNELVAHYLDILGSGFYKSSSYGCTVRLPSN